MSLCKNIWPVAYKVVTYKLLRRFHSNILFKILICFILNIIAIIIFGRLALFRHTFNGCDLLCNFTITYVTLNKVIQFNSIHFSPYSVRIPENTDQKKVQKNHIAQGSHRYRRKRVRVCLNLLKSNVQISLYVQRFMFLSLNRWY